MPSPQFRWFLLTIPEEDFIASRPSPVQYIKGQKEEGESGYRHWQLIAYFGTKTTVTRVREVFGGRAHVEPSRSAAAIAYVWKEDTRIEGTQFELGEKPVRRNSKEDWDQIWELAKAGDFNTIPKNILVPHYRSIRTIASDFGRTIAMDRSCVLYWGRTGTGKSHRAWQEAGMDAYSKDPRTKFWDGYRGEKHVVIDEFRGSIDIAHLLRWLDKYPVRVEIKGSSTPLLCERIWITSNIPIERWYESVDEETLAALRRRLNITHFDALY